jgi:NADH dehydrogenase (ubiquinone) 1 beta subcomplex subunit 8
LFVNIICIIAAHGWNKDFKPGPYPKTQAEREAAAKKYGLHPSEYEPYPDDGTGCKLTRK